jgi:hypothetical protein
MTDPACRDVGGRPSISITVYDDAPLRDVACDTESIAWGPRLLCAVSLVGCADVGHLS